MNQYNTQANGEKHDSDSDACGIHVKQQVSGVKEIYLGPNNEGKELHCILVPDIVYTEPKKSESIEAELSEIEEQLESLKQKIDDIYEKKEGPLEYIASDEHDALDDKYTRLIIKRDNLVKHIYERAAESEQEIIYEQKEKELFYEGIKKHDKAIYEREDIPELEPIQETEPIPKKKRKIKRIGEKSKQKTESPSPYTQPETRIKDNTEHPYITARKKEITLEKAFVHNSEEGLEKFVEIIQADTLYVPKPKIKAEIWDVKQNGYGKKKLVAVEHKTYQKIPLGPIFEEPEEGLKEVVDDIPYTPSRLEKMESYVSKKFVGKMPEKAQSTIRSAYQAVKSKVKKIPLLGRLFR